MKTIGKHSYDVVVVGSGAGALTAAIRAHDLGMSVLVVEKSSQYGGTSAISGGGIWIPTNDQIAALGGSDSFDEAYTYVKAAARGTAPEKRLRAYLHTAPRMLDYVQANTPLRFRALPNYPDYYPALPGAKPGYRTMEPDFFNAARLHDEFPRLREPSPGTVMFGGISMGQAEANIIFCKRKGWLGLTLGRMLGYWLDVPWRLRTRRDRRLALGNALIAALRRAMMDRGIPLWLDTAFVSLGNQQGRITSVTLRQGKATFDVAVRRGVILGAGGFERNQAMRDHYLPKPSRTEWSATPPHNTGDAIRAGIEAGAAVALMDRLWGAPTMRVPGEEKQRAIFAERASPGCILVNRAGKRFVNDGGPYLELVDAMYASPENMHAWIIFDAAFRQKYAMGALLPASVQPDRKLPKDWLGKVYFRAASLAELAGQIGVDAGGLAETVQRMNTFASTGVDTDFGRGGNIYDTYYGDPANHPNPCLAPIGKGPFYAIRLDAGDIGTKGGLVTDEHACVLDKAEQPITGLYAIGNTASAVMGVVYPGPGSTLGPAMTFGYAAANHIAAHVRPCA